MKLFKCVNNQYWQLKCQYWQRFTGGKSLEETAPFNVIFRTSATRRGKVSPISFDQPHQLKHLMYLTTGCGKVSPIDYVLSYI